MNIKFTHKIRFKITGAMILCSLIMALLISSISIYTHYKFSNKEINEKLTLLPQNYSNKFNSDFKTIESSVNTLEQYVSESFDLEKLNANPNGYAQQYEKMMDPIIKRIAQTTEGVQGVYFTFNPELTGNLYESWFADPAGTGSFIKKKENYLKEFYPSNEKMSWYYKPIVQNKGVWDKPSIDNVLNIWSISYTKPVYKGNVLLGVVGIDVSMDTMKKTIESLKIYQTGFCFLFDENYNFLIHPIFKPKDNLKSVENGNFKFVAEEMNKRDSGIIKYKVYKKDKILGYNRLSNGWILGFVVPTDEVYAPLKAQIIMITIAIHLAIGIIILIALYLGKTISKPIAKITQLIRNTSNFKFDENQSLKLLAKNKDEIGIMAKEMASMQKILKETGVDRAAHFQKQSLQKEFPISSKASMEVLYVPSKMVSGDFYHIAKINDDVVIGVIYDVSGKGVTAALNTSAFYVLFHEAVSVNQNPIEILNYLNVKVASFFGETYIAACCFSFDFQGNLAQIAGAGINQFMYSSCEEKYQTKNIKGAFLGMFEDSVFDQETINFKQGDKFYFLTDGLEVMFSDENLRKKFINISDSNELIDVLQTQLFHLQATSDSIVDDCTLIALEIK